MHGAESQQARGAGRGGCGHDPVDDDDARPTGHGRLGLVGQVLDGSAQAPGAVADGDGRLQAGHRVGAAARAEQRADGRRIDEERLEGEQPGGLGRFREKRHAGAEQGAQAHDEAFAQGIDRRVGDLGESLPQVVRHRSWPSRHGSERRVVPHGEGGFVGVGGHGLEHHGELFLRVPVSRLPLHQVGRRLGHRLARLERGETVGRPLGVRRGGGHVLLDGRIADHTEVGGDHHHVPGPEAATVDHAVPGGVDGPHLRGAHDHAVLADGVPQRSQAVAVEDCANPRAVGEDHARRPVPGLHESGVVLVEATDVGVQVTGLLPRLGDEHGHGMAEVTPAPHEHLGRLVEHPRIAVVGIEHGTQELLGAESGLHGSEVGPGPHPALVAADGVDLSVVAEEAERLGPLPRGQGVGAEALVEDGQGSGEALVGQVEVERVEGVGRDQALVDDRTERARHHVGVAVRGLEAAPHPVGPTLEVLGLGVERLVGHGGGRDRRPRRLGLGCRSDQGLEDPRSGGKGEVAERGVVGGRRAPPHHVEAFGLGRRRDLRRGIGVAGEEHDHTRALAVDRLWNGGEQTGAVGGSGVGRHRAAVLDVGQTGESGGDDGSGWSAVGVGDEADAARVELTHGCSWGSLRR